MQSVRAVLLVTLAVCGALAGTLPTAAAPSTESPVSLESAPTPTTESDAMETGILQSEGNETSGNASVGAEISSFMQTSVAQTQGTVETGIWLARFNQTENESARDELVRGQTTRLQQDLNALQQRKRALVEARENGNISELQYRAEMSGVIGQLRALDYSINETHPRAVTVGSQTGELRELDRQVAAANDRDVIAVGRSLRGVTAPGENANNSTGAPSLGNGNGSIGNGSLFPGVGLNNSTGTPGDGASVSGTPGNGTDSSDGTPGNGLAGSGEDDPGQGSLLPGGDGAVDSAWILP